jgi:hypothetical protein
MCYRWSAGKNGKWRWLKSIDQASGEASRRSLVEYEYKGFLALVQKPAATARISGHQSNQRHQR